MMNESGRLPDELRELLDGSDLESRTGLVFELVSVAPSGWPHVALLSVGEVVALNESQIGFALWPTSTTTDNLRRSARGLLQAYHAGAAYRVRLAFKPVGEEQASGGKLALLVAHVEGVVRDAVSYATLTTGPTIVLPDAQRVVARWRNQVQLIRAAVPQEGTAG